MLYFKKNFQKKHTKIAGIFTKAQSQLEALSLAVTAENAKKLERISKLQEEVAANEALVAQGSKLATNLNKLLND